MSLDEVHITEALSRYAEGVVMTSTDMDRMQDDLHRRLRPPHHRRGRLVAAVAAALLLVAAIAGATWWLRKPPDPVPVTPQPVGSLTGVWKFSNPLTNSMFVVRADGNVSEYPDATSLVRRLVDLPSRVVDEGQRIRVEFTDPQGQPCQAEQAVLERRDGFVAGGPQTLTGPGCTSATAPESTIIRLTPSSEAARNLPVATEGVAVPVNDAVQLQGMWVLQGTDLMLVVDEKGGPPEYLMDNDGDIDTSPDARGAVTIPSAGNVVLASSSCGDSRLQRGEVRIQEVNQTFTATVDSDPCQLFEGRTTLTWVRVL